MKRRVWAGAGILLTALTLGVEYPVQNVLAQEDSSSTILLNVEGDLEDGDTAIPSDNSLYDEYPLEGKAGQEITITLESDEFDPYLIVLTSDQQLVDQIDDISEENLNAQLTITLPADDTYTIVANAYDETGRGHYTLTVSEVDPSGAAADEEEPPVKAHDAGSV